MKILLQFSKSSKKSGLCYLFSVLIGFSNPMLIEADLFNKQSLDSLKKFLLNSQKNLMFLLFHAIDSTVESRISPSVICEVFPTIQDILDGYKNQSKSPFLIGLNELNFLIQLLWQVMDAICENKEGQPHSIDLEAYNELIDWENLIMKVFDCLNKNSHFPLFHRFSAK